MFLKFKNDWDGYAANEVVYFENVGMARRLMDLGVAQTPSYDEIEVKVLKDHENKMVKTYENKSKVTKKKSSGPPKRKRGRPRKQPI